MNAKNSMVRSAYALALVVGIAAGSLGLMAGCSSLPPEPGDGNGGTDGEPTASKFVGADTCRACHPGMHADWTGTAHATALDSLEAIGQGENAACLPCHTVGFNDDGFVSRAETPALVGVQCENCHGPAADHATNPDDLALRPTVDMASTLCGTCHTGAHNPTFDEWQLSKHASALEGLRSNPFAQDGCLECHSQDYRHAVEEQEEGEDIALPTVETAQLSVECATCHAPHGGVDQEHQLRQSIANLCGECHTQEEATLGSTPHHPQIEMVTGTGAFSTEGDAFNQAGPHTGLFATGGAACAQCHVVVHEVDDPNEGAPNHTGHTFNPFDEEITAFAPEHQAEQYGGCLMCHGTADAADERRTRVQSELFVRLAVLAPFFDPNSASYIDAESLSEANQFKLATAKFNFEFVEADGSKGVHNSTYATALLDIADQIIDGLPGQ